MECVNGLYFWVGDYGCMKPTQSVRRGLHVGAGVRLTRGRSEEQPLCGYAWPLIFLTFYSLAFVKGFLIHYFVQFSELS